MAKGWIQEAAIYIGTQGILQGTYETFAAAAEQQFGRSLAVTVAVGFGEMGREMSRASAVSIDLPSLDG